MKHHLSRDQFNIDGTTYLSLDQVAEEIQVSRTTLWRWRQSGKVPAGHRYRGRLTLFTLSELAEIRDYANRLAPIGLGQGADNGQP